MIFDDGCIHAEDHIRKHLLDVHLALSSRGTMNDKLHQLSIRFISFEAKASESRGKHDVFALAMLGEIHILERFTTLDIAS